MSLFTKVATRAPKRNKFDLSHEKKLTGNMGNLIPIMLQEIVPGDKFRVNTEVLIRFAPLLAPMMHRVNVFTHFFFVPNRLIWSEWETFITGGRLGTDAPVHPYVAFPHMTNFPGGIGSLADYFGLQAYTGVAPTNPKNVSALPFRAYQLIWDEYYRDQNLTASIAIDKSSGQVTNATELQKLSTLRQRAWEKDYLTSALPWAQRGGDVNIPTTVNYRNPSIVRSQAGTAQTGNQLLGTTSGTSTAGELVVDKTTNTTGTTKGYLDNIASIGATINDLRRSMRLQEWLEKNARGGARYIEQILSHFGVISSDARLQRPEYLGGSRTPVVVSEVVSTFQENGGTIPQGNLAGHGISVGSSNGFARSFEEHGFVIGLMSVLPKTAYQQGIPRLWSRTDKLDYYWPEFANIGEQAIKSNEVLVDYESAQTNTDWGYQSRYAEYKYQPSTVHGYFKSTLAYWGMQRIFTGPVAPGLNESFITSDPTHRVFAVTDPAQHKLYCQIYHNVDALRPMPYFGTPML